MVFFLFLSDIICFCWKGEKVPQLSSCDGKNQSSGQNFLSFCFLVSRSSQVQQHCLSGNTGNTSVLKEEREAETSSLRTCNTLWTTDEQAAWLIVWLSQQQMKDDEDDGMRCPPSSYPREREAIDFQHGTQVTSLLSASAYSCAQEERREVSFNKEKIPWKILVPVWIFEAMISHNVFY